ncbi:MAG: hypothetical protein SH808_10975 [Saprospiraceae bacterium]|mgnify:CR=1 FL=1|nr:hypothetical protein [Saprospiraceae bacterium]
MQTSRPELHVVTFAVPYPANYGGAIDVWNRIVALKRAGVRIHLHCFVYGVFLPQPMLEEYVEKVYYYPRVKWPALFLPGQPYIVTSRKSKELLKNLYVDRSPVLFEGIHSTGFVRELKDRKLLLRAHNIEHQYYAELANQCKGVKSLIFRRESLCLRDYERALAGRFDMVFAISPPDTTWYIAHGAKTVCLPPFHGYDEVNILIGRGDYLLYQGDLSIQINQEGLFDLLGKIPYDQSYPIVAAGRSGDKTFEEKLSRFPNLRREADVTQEKMIDLIRNAQLILVHGLHGSGMKLKIFPALYHGRFVAATANSRTNTSLDKALLFYEPDEVVTIIKAHWAQAFSVDMVKERVAVLSQQMPDDEKAGEILRYL